MLAFFVRDLPNLVQPLNLTWLLLTGGLLWALVRRRWRSALAWFLPWAPLSLFSCTALPGVMVFYLEQRWEGIQVENLPPSDVILCLGGGAEASLREPAGFRMQRSADRITTALMLARSGKGQTLVISGGESDEFDQPLGEANAVRAWMEKWQLSPIPILSLGVCENTHDEAVKFAALAKEHHWEKVILATSAFHMTRAQATFQKAGVNVTPFPCNFIGYPAGWRRYARWFHFPNFGSLELFDVWWHETIGWWVYKARGWI